jgi:predicted RecA/RadA family phage recombinase
MKNFVQPGESMTYTAPMGGVTSGVGVQIGQILVIAAITAAAGDPFTGITCGVISHAKAGSQAWAEGAIVYWDEGNKRFTTVAAGHLQAGTAAAAVGAGAGETTGVVRLDGIGRAQEDT